MKRSKWEIQIKNKMLIINKWVKAEDDLYVLKKWIHIPLTLYCAYIIWIYPHLGICHKDLRSKYYIGKAREER